MAQILNIDTNFKAHCNMHFFLSLDVRKGSNIKCLFMLLFVSEGSFIVLTGALY